MFSELRGWGKMDWPGAYCVAIGPLCGYEAYASKTGLTHGQCWNYCRREFINADAAKTLEIIGGLYAVEACH